jgi:8-oxo-dGTP pyrophosphatase MutT (NUDIX family)
VLYKIKFEEHTLFIIDDVCSFSFDLIGKNRAIIYKYTKPKKLKKIVDEIKTSPILNHIIIHHNTEEIFLELELLFNVIKAAGGLIINEKNEILFIYRNKKWDLPKGKIEKNETPEHAAIREVEEETLVKISSLKHHLVSTYHTYFYDQKYILKTNYWFLMYADSHQKLSPQLEENIEKVEWKTIADIPELMNHSYESIKDVINVYLDANNVLN